MEKENILNEESIKEDLRYLQLLAQSYPTIADASTEIINLLRNASGYVKRKVEEIFGTTLRKAEKKELCTLIYYPEQKLQLIKATEQNLNDFYVTTLNQLIKVCREVSSKYTRSKIRKELPKEFGYIIEELLHESYSAYGEKKHEYYNVIMQSIINTQRADEFIIEICKLIQRPPALAGRHFRPRTRCASHHGNVVQLQSLRHRLGQPRHRMVWRCSRQPSMHLQCASHHLAIWQSANLGGWLRHQPPSTCYLRYGSV